MKTLVICDVMGKNARASVGAAVKLGAPIDVLCFDTESAQNLAKIDGVDAVLCAPMTHLLAEPIADLVAGLDYQNMIAPANTFGKDVLPRVAGILGVDMVSDIISIESADTFVRPIYAGNALATVQNHERIKLISIRASSFDGAPDGANTAPISTLDVPSARGASFESETLADSARPELATASRVVTGGRALGSGENFVKYIEPLADKLGAAVGGSRVAVDLGYIGNDLQVGQTGKIVAPDLYIAAGVSGAIQHLAGMKDSKVIVAINTDPEAPIVKIADYYLNADVFEALPELTAKL